MEGFNRFNRSFLAIVPSGWWPSPFDYVSLRPKSVSIPRSQNDADELKVVAAFESCCCKIYNVEDHPKKWMSQSRTKSNPSKFRACDLGEQMLDRFERLASGVVTIWLPILTLWKRINPYDLNLPVGSPYSSRVAVKSTKSSIFPRRQIWM